MIRKYLFNFSLILIFVLFGFLSSVNAQEAELTDNKLPTVYFFYGDGCPHCDEEEEFFKVLKQDYPELQIELLEVWYNFGNATFLKDVTDQLNVKTAGVPVTVVGEQVVIGFNSQETTGEKIREVIQQCLDNTCVDAVSLIKQGTYDGKSADVFVENETCAGSSCKISNNSKTINLPFLGEVNPQTFSLPVLTIIIAGFDGFNPCAMWVLLFLISLLLGMEDRKKMWILGSTFIITSGVIYFLFLAAWLNLFLFLGFISYVRIAIGIIAITSGVYHLKEWWEHKIACKVTQGKFKKKLMDKLKLATSQKIFWLSFVGIISVAIAVNMVELVCSAGLPAIYTQVLALSNLSPLAYYSYLLLYIFIFILDDLAVFIVAMITLETAGATGKYTHWSNLIGGIVILILGVLLIFKPGLVMFG